MRTAIHNRALFLGLLLASTFFGVWWMPLLIGVLMLVWMRAPEVIFFGLLFDLVFASFQSSLFFGAYTLTFLVCGVLGELVRRRLLWTQ